MRNLSSELKAHLAGEVTTLAKCWKITLKDSSVKALTELDQSLTIDSVEYKAVGSFESYNSIFDSDCSTDNMGVSGILQSEHITETELLAGVYDEAAVEVFLVNYQDLPMGKLVLFTGFFGQVKVIDGQFWVELHSLSDKLEENTIGEVYSPTCRAEFGDSRCQINKATYTFSGTVSAIVDGGFKSSDLSAQDDGYFDYGLVTFTSGNNNGLSREVRNYRGDKIILAVAFPYNIAIDDSFTIVAGCDKICSTCKDKFSNMVNFRGEPHLPGNSYLYQSN